MMKPFFCRVGNKNPIEKQIIEMIPPHKIYVEAFVGGGAVYFAKEHSEVEVINDLDKPLMDGYKLIKKISRESEEQLANFARHLGDETEKDRLIIMNDFMKIEPDEDGLKLYQLILNFCNTFNCLGLGLKIYESSTQITKILKLRQYKERLKNTKLFQLDYKKVIKKFDTEETFFFLDPPYENSTRLYTNGSINYCEMIELLKNIKGKFLLTINSSEIIKNIFQDFNILEIDVVGGSRNNASFMGTTTRKESIITNYTLS